MLRRYRTLNNDTEVNVDGARLRAGDDGVFVVEAGSREEDVLIAGGAISAHLFSMLFDEDGNLIANVNHRTGTLAYLLSIVGGEGEIAIATDAQVLVKYGVGGAPYIYGTGSEIDRYQALSSTGNAVASGVLTDLTLDTIVDGPAGNFTLASGLIVATNRTISGRQKMVFEASCVVEIASPVTTLGTYRNVILRGMDLVAVFQILGRMTVPPAPLGQPTRVAFHGKAIIHSNDVNNPQFKVSVIQDSGESLNCTLLDLTVSSKLRNV